MPKTFWIMLLLAGAAIAALVTQWQRHRSITPEALYQAGLARLEAEEGARPDYEGALREFDLALTQAGKARNRELIRQILESRAKMYVSKGTIGKAREDYRRLLTGVDSEDAHYMRVLGGLALREEDLEKTLEYSNRLREIDPRSPHGWALRGQAIRLQIAESMKETHELLDNSLADRQATEAHKLADQIASRSANDPSRVALLDELESLFGPLSRDHFLTAQRNLLAASHRSDMARQAFVESLERQLNPDGMRHMLELLYESGHYGPVVELGLGAVQHVGIRSRKKALHTVTDALAALGRPHKASEVIEMARRSGATPDNEGILQWAEILYRAERWKQLREIVAPPHALLKRNSAQDQGTFSQLTFYLGMALHGLNRVSEAQRMLDTFVAVPKVQGELTIRDLNAKKSVEPFEGAMVDAHLALAKLARRRNKKKIERHHLGQALHAAPLASPESWARLYKIQKGSNAPLRDQERSLVNTIRLQPELAEHLTPEWTRLGRRILLAVNKDPSTLGASALRSEGRWFPEFDATPYELYRLAEIHEDWNEPGGAAACLTHLLAEYPYFGPARDRLTRLYVEEIGRPDLAVELLLSELEELGPTPETLAQLRSLPRELFDGKDMQRLIHFDPEYTGMFEIANYLYERGEIDRAYRAIGSADFDVTGSRGRLLAGRLLLERGEYEETLRQLFPIPPEDPQFTESIALRAQAAMALGDADLLRTSIGELTDTDQLDQEQAVALADRLLRAGHPEIADLLLERLDRSPSARGGTVFLRRARLALQSGHSAAAFEHLERAEAYMEGGSPELGRVLRALRDGDWRRLPEELAMLRVTGLNVTQMQHAMLLTLEDNIEAARPLFAQVQFEADDSVQWLLASAALMATSGEPLASLPFDTAAQREAANTILKGEREHPHDPRELLGVLIAMGTTHWLPYAEALLSERAEELSKPNVWVEYLLAVCEQRLDSQEDAEARLTKLIELAPDFAPAWNAVERLMFARLQQRDHPDLLSFRGRRRDALKQGEESMAETLLLEAYDLHAKGITEQAIERANSAHRFAPEHPGPLLMVARLQVETEQYLDSLGTYTQLFETLDRSEAAKYVPEYLAAVRSARIGGLTTPGSGASIAESLHRIGSRLPHNPLLVVALAELEVASIPESVTVGVSRAWARLDTFREFHASASIESLAPGGTRAWFNFMVDIDPRRAGQFVRAELDYTPGNPDLYEMLGDALVAQNQLTEGFDQYERLLRILPEPPVLVKAASVLADICTGPADVQAFGERFEDLRAWDLDDPVAQYIRARAYLAGNPTARDFGINILAKLWEQREEPGFELDALELGWRYGTSLTHRGLTEDRKTAIAIFDELIPQLTTPLRIHVGHVLSRLAVFLPNATPEPPKNQTVSSNKG